MFGHSCGHRFVPSDAEILLSGLAPGGAHTVGRDHPQLPTVPDNMLHGPARSAEIHTICKSGKMPNNNNNNSQIRHTVKVCHVGPWNDSIRQRNFEPHTPTHYTLHQKAQPNFQPTAMPAFSATVDCIMR